MSKTEKHVRDLSRAEYEAARRAAVRNEPPPRLAPCDRPLPAPVQAMTDEQYREAKRAIGMRN